MSIMLSAIYAECRKQAHYAEYLYAQCLYAEYCYAECRGALVVFAKLLATINLSAWAL